MVIALPPKSLRSSTESDLQHIIVYDADMTHYHIRPRAEIDRAVWDAFVDASDEAWLWHRYDLLDALATWPGRRDISFCVVEDDGDAIVALLPLDNVRHTTGKIVHWGYFDSLGGIAFRSNLVPKVRQNVWNIARARLMELAVRHDAMEINFSIAAPTPSVRGERAPLINPLLHLGFQNFLTQTWMVDLRGGEEAVWKNMEGRARTAVRKAEKNEVTIRRADRAGDLDIYYALHCETYARTGAHPHPKAYFETIWNKFQTAGFAAIYFAEQKGQVIAAENFALFKKAALYWTGAATDEGLAASANSLIQWTAMQDMIRQGIEWYDVGAGFPHYREGKLRSLSDFKKSFGGTLVPFFRGRLDVPGTKFKVLRFLRSWRSIAVADIA